jgi:hypothetical protein
LFSEFVTTTFVPSGLTITPRGNWKFPGRVPNPPQEVQVPPVVRRSIRWLNMSETYSSPSGAKATPNGSLNPPTTGRMPPRESK